MRLIITLAMWLLVTPSATGIPQSTSGSSNVVLIMTADAGYADIGSYGARHSFQGVDKIRIVDGTDSRASDPSR